MLPKKGLKTMKAHKNSTVNENTKHVLQTLFSFISAYKREISLITYHYLILPNSSFMLCVAQKLL